MIRIRYKDLSPGSHGKAERGARGTTVYLLPGLTWGQRRAALRRLRQESSRGCGPALPTTGLAFAIAADRCRVGVRSAAAVVRLHPAGSLVPSMLAGALMALFVLAPVSARMAQPSAAPPPGGTLAAGGAPTVVGTPVLASGAGHGAGRGAQGARGSGGEGSTGGSGVNQDQAKTSWSLTASSSSGSGSASRGGSAGTTQACGASASGQAASQASSACHPGGLRYPSRPVSRPSWPLPPLPAASPG